MSWEQAVLFAIMGGVLALLLWGRWRYDVVAFGGLVLAVVLGVVERKHAFDGFGHPAVIVIALVLIVSRGLMQSGALEGLTRKLAAADLTLGMHILVMGAVGAFLSAFMNNVAALALLMPIDIQAAKRAKRSPALTLMPLSFATILGGMTTMIGTPPNIVVAQFRETALGAPYGMFDFSPVGVGVAVVGIAFIALAGWRLIPAARGRADMPKELGQIESYVMEVLVPASSPAIGRKFRELKKVAEESDVWLLALVRRGRREKRPAGADIRKGDILVIEGGPEGLEQFATALKLDLSKSRKHSALMADSLAMTEVVIPKDSRIVGRSSLDLRLLARRGVVVVGIARQGRRVKGRVRQEKIRPGDLLLLMGPENGLEETVQWLGALPVERRTPTVVQRQKAWLAIGLFGLAISLAAVDLVYLPVALAAVGIAYVALRIISLNQIYESVEWPVIVLLASLIPIGAALESSGGTALIAEGILRATEGLAPLWVLLVIMVVTMTLSDMLNNVATVLVAGPVAVRVAQALDVNPDTMLMGVAVAASCAFLTPIGHKNNTIIMGPGGYSFGDYWRMGLPLELVVLAVSVPLILLVWPL